MGEKVSYKNQPASWYYENHRRGLIQRHICSNGRLLQEVLLVEQDPSKPPPHATFHANRRHSIELIAETGDEYDYSGYPVVVFDPDLRDVRRLAQDRVSERGPHLLCGGVVPRGPFEAHADDAAFDGEQLDRAPFDREVREKPAHLARPQLARMAHVTEVHEPAYPLDVRLLRAGAVMPRPYRPAHQREQRRSRSGHELS